ncbi:MAG TPA: flagellin lysine-N-methylase [Pseudobacteroides sp.]|uniref:flagellin lysine-N-methylase n=1 Tax=Pseudobacteroides sp. TaxID=1968840 RepID=UPI002F940E30
MNERKRPVLEPQYMKRFRCIGSACEDSCCKGWRVDIDHETYRKYKKVKDDELTAMFESYIHRNRADNHADNNYAKVKLIDDAKCPFLTEESLCKIQLKRGEEYLSDVCATYPRNANIINNTLERSLTMSCPEAARIALLDPKEMEFDEYEETVSTRNIVKISFNTKDIKFNNKPYKYLWELRIFIINVLQDRRMRLSERLIVLGMFFNKLQEYLNENRVDDIPVLIGTYVNYLETDAFGESLKGIPVQYNIQMELLKEISDRRYQMGVNSTRYIECFAEFLNGIEYRLEATIEENGERYRSAWEDYYEPFMKEREYILENYLVNYVFRTAFPFSNEKNIFDIYTVMVLHYALIKMQLIGMAGFRKGLTDECVVKLIQAFAKAVEHNKVFINDMVDVLRRNGYNTMTFMAILIKN